MKAKWLVMLLMLSALPLVRGEIVRDHASNPAWWNGFGIVDHFIDPDPGWTAVGAAPVPGNGKEFKRLAFVLAQSNVYGQPNQGDLNELEFRFRFFPDIGSFTLQSFYEPPAQENWEAVLMPVNQDWQTPAGWYLVFHLYWVEFDLHCLRLKTEPGQMHLVSMTPQSVLPSPWTITMIGTSRDVSGPIGAEQDWYVRGWRLGAYGPGELQGYLPQFKYLAYLITVGYRSDLNEDDVVDIDDFELFADAMTGPEAALDCHPADLDSDGDIDLADFAVFQAEFGLGQ